MDLLKTDKTVIAWAEDLARAVRELTAARMGHIRATRAAARAWRAEQIMAAGIGLEVEAPPLEEARAVLEAACRRLKEATEGVENARRALPPRAAEACMAAAVAEARALRVESSRRYVILAAICEADLCELYNFAEKEAWELVKPIPASARPKEIWDRVGRLANSIGVGSAGMGRRHAQSGFHWDRAAILAGLMPT